MLEILPSINRSTWQEVESDIRKIKNHADWVEIDVADGTLSKVKTWNNPEDLKNLKIDEPLRLCIHLMVKNPEKYLKQWIDAKVRRIIVQYEGIPGGFLGLKTKNAVKRTSVICKENWVEFGLSISPKTSTKELGPFLDLLDVVHILAVPIGLNSQNIDLGELNRMTELKSLQSGKKFRTEWDGGVNPETIVAIKKSGADMIASTSFVFDASQPDKALEVLKKTAIGIGV